MTLRPANIVVSGLLLLLACAPGTGLSAVVNHQELLASLRALNFVEGLPKDGKLTIGVVHAGDAEPARRVAAAFSALRGPKGAMPQAVTIDVDELSDYSGRIDAIYLMPGASNAAGTVLDTLHQRRVVSISSDADCRETRCCVLLVTAGKRVEIVLDTALTEALDLHFATVFTLMVKRR